MKKSWIMLVSTVLSLSLTGCGVNDNAGGNDNTGGQHGQTNAVKTRNVNNDRNNRTLTISDRAEQQVERMEEVDNAHVIISDNNAYVAVRLANNNNTAGNRTNNGNNGGVGTGNVNNNLDNNRNGTVNRNGNNGITDGGLIRGFGDAGDGNRQNTATGHGGNNNNTFGMGNGNNNNNGTGGNNAGGNAARTNNYSEVSNSFEQKIADQVRQADSKIHRVYVSVNPDLYNRMNTFAGDIRTDRNRDGLFEDFTNTVNDFFNIRND